MYWCRVFKRTDSVSNNSSSSERAVYTSPCRGVHRARHNGKATHIGGIPTKKKKYKFNNWQMAIIEISLKYQNNY